MACCVALAMVIAYLLAFRERLARWRRPALVGLSVALAIAVVTLGLHHRRHLSHHAEHSPTEARR